MNYKLIITGATGMVGEGVLLECLAHPRVSEVLSVSRKSNGMKHPKLKEYLVADFLSLKNDDEKLKGYDACFFCAGVSSIGMKEDDYSRITYDTTLHFANVALQQNPNMTFIYVSGASTDSSEKGKIMWARVIGKTENALKAYKYFAWMYPILKALVPDRVSTLKQVGLAMMNALIIGSDKQILEVKDINELGNR
jgi:nucleoside-diphosphate-sugar epimerase